jgi:5-methylcytosine-specific restriction endonuclease McrA
MWPVPRPSVPAKTAYESCWQKLKDATLKGKYVEATNSIVRASDRFEDSAIDGTVHLLEPHDFQPEKAGLGRTLAITSQDLNRGLYVDRMAKPGSAGRPIYDQIKLAAPHGVCPLCGVRQVSTLDHYLPRSKFAALSVAPLNLVPACFECNRSKQDSKPSTELDKTFHPYFEDTTSIRWLQCEVIEGVPAIVRFFVKIGSGLSVTLEERIRHHFTVFGLDGLYAHHATTELSSIRSLLRWTLEAAGSAAVRNFLGDQARSAQVNDLNSWKGAMYEALSGNDWYCSGGFKGTA